VAYPHPNEWEMYECAHVLRHYCGVSMPIEALQHMDRLTESISMPIFGYAVRHRHDSNGADLQYESSRAGSLGALIRLWVLEVER